VSNENFVTAMHFVLEHECRKNPDGSLDPGYVNNPKDPGGETKYGIAKRSHPDVDIKNLTVDDALQIYWNDYWDALGLDDVDDAKYCTCVLDAAVNCGISRAKAWSQDAKGDIWKFNNSRTIYYYSAIESNPRLAIFKNGWLARVADLKKYIDLIPVS
jgi:lysozyme family protein